MVDVRSVKSLVIDDQVTARMLLKCLLEDLGEVVEAGTAAVAIAAYRQALRSDRPFDVVCVDLGLPDRSGIDVVREIRAAETAQGLMPGDGAKVIVITASEDPEHEATAQRQHADAFLRKPLSYDGLRQALLDADIVAT